MLTFKDKTKKEIRLSRERWIHIIKKHAEIPISILEMEQTLQIPLKIIQSKYDKNVKYYVKYFKKKRFLRVSVKYLNNHGYIITAYFEKQIK